MKNLTITYGGLELVNTEVDECQFTDTDTQVSIVGKFKRAAPAAGGGLSAIADLLVNASKTKTEQRKRELTEDAADDD